MASFLTPLPPSNIEASSPNNVPEVPREFSKVEGSGRQRERQSRVLELGGIKLEYDEGDPQSIKQLIDAVYSKYLVSRNRVHQYTNFLTMLKREEDTWAERFKRASNLMPDYKPPMEWIA
ncbi:uncharacterized protein HD556DRAFT_1439340 [Suillus plorans]|uniref:Uncharacterized protein n=1 Tax=Suillus plorans TaxID=116603 RepID=A0A9P7DP80_9AGAM|nr:uncharacterized protein HD556DRAFT_1439340 [Suillus plorans]KAG1799681.1 hypothetical protein HD556DRAFT_1439340 [Suillus plorans]